MTDRSQTKSRPEVPATSTPDSASARLDRAFRFGLGLDDDVKLKGLAYGEPEDWDSVAHMQLVAALENAFDIMLDTDDVIAMSDYGQVRRILAERYGVPVEP